MSAVSLARAIAFTGVLASIATAIGVALAGWQLRLSQRLASTQFEDQLAMQYRARIQDLPVDALLGESLPPEELHENLATFYHYFDLSNEQVFLHERGRVRESTWNEWRSGIEQNLRRPAFREAWSEIARRAPDSFDELRRVAPPL